MSRGLVFLSLDLVGQPRSQNFNKPHIMALLWHGGLLPTSFRSLELIADAGSILRVGAVRNASVASADHPWSHNRLSTFRANTLFVGDRLVSAHERSFIVESHLVANGACGTFYDTHHRFAARILSFPTTPAEVRDFSAQQVHVVERVDSGVRPLSQLPRVHKSGTTGRLIWGCNPEWSNVSGHLWRDESCVRNVLQVLHLFFLLHGLLNRHMGKRWRDDEI